MFSDSRRIIICLNRIRDHIVRKGQRLGATSFIMSVWHVFIHIWYYLFAYCVLYGNWIFDGCDDNVIRATIWFMPVSLEIRKWLAYKDFILKDSKLLVQLQCPSRKQSTTFIIFLACSILSAKTDPLVSIDLVFW